MYAVHPSFWDPWAPGIDSADVPEVEDEYDDWEPLPITFIAENFSEIGLDTYLVVGNKTNHDRITDEDYNEVVEDLM